MIVRSASDKQVLQYDMLTHLGQQLTSSLDPKIVLSLITQYATELLDSHSSVLLLRNEYTGETRYVSVFNLAEEEFFNKRLSSTESLGSQIINTQKPILLNDYGTYARRVAILESYEIKAVIGVPIIWQDQAIGALNVHSNNPDQRYTENDIKILSSFANFAAIAIINARVHAQVQNELHLRRALNEIMQVSRLNCSLQDLLTKLAAKIKGWFMGLDFVLMVLNPLSSITQFAGSHPLPQEQMEKLKELMNVTLVSAEDSEALPGERSELVLSTENALAMPLVGRHRKLGYMVCLNPDVFLEHDGMRIMQNITDHVALTIENALLHLETRGDLQQALEQMGALNYAIREITESALLETLPQNIVNMARSLLGAQGGLLLTGGEGKSLSLAAFSGMDEARSAELSARIIMHSKQYAITRNHYVENLLGSGVEEVAGADGQGYAFALFLPMLFQNERIALLVMFQAEPFVRSSGKVLVSRIFADIASIALKNAELFSNERKTVHELRYYSEQMRASQEALEDVFALHNKLLHLVLNNRPIQEITDAVHGSTGHGILVEDHMGNVLSRSSEDLPFSTIYSQREVPDVIVHYQKALRSKEPVTLIDAHDCVRYLVPLIVGMKVLGFVSLFVCSDAIEVMDRHIIESSATAYALTILNINRSLDIERQLKGQVLEALIQESYPAKQKDLVHRAGYLGLSAEAQYRILLIRVDTKEPLPQLENLQIKQELLESVPQATLHFPIKPAFFSDAQGLVIACPVTGSTDVSLEKIFSRLEKEVAVRFKRNDKLYCGVSSVLNGLLEFRKGYQEAGKALLSAKTWRMGTLPVYFDRLGIVGFLFQEGNEDLLDSFVRNAMGGLIELDEKAKMSLVDTLEQYLDHDCSLIDTSQAMFIHTNTLKYRLKKIQEVIQADLTKTTDRVNLYFACKLFRIMKAKDQPEFTALLQP
ncbi:GAF domain protein [Acididesulfobacillus acetoxydans]|uniref:GAF domain protein n=1 Tax=Acididesulfobacillus acetoxydans TaxID=1561005 RepID=A0A8S0XV84_9FIRM|nr:GAF domain-containing protein [Acididesulfobacillus acetoxydans]CAA7600087.1 GAF domain protein [Acididesulfobacillus acetoxydans]CEJ07669.1 PucR C-terminal helix-turn-helix domain [Acididesulfobacillus acetoxydans]